MDRTADWGQQCRGAVRISEDCGGLGTSGAALNYVVSRQPQGSSTPRVNFGFASELEPVLRTHLGFSYDPVFPDMLQRDFPMDINVGFSEIYTSGFPCQPFAGNGLRLGGADDRSLPMRGTLVHIRLHQPKIFILENVIGMKSAATILKRLMRALRRSRQYRLTCEEYDTLTHGGTLQSRRRLFIIGIRADVSSHPMPTLPEIAPCAFSSLVPVMCANGDYVGKVAERNTVFALAKQSQHSGHMIVADMMASPTRMQVGIDKCPCLTKTRCAHHGFAVVLKGGGFYKLSSSDMLRLQGWPQPLIDGLIVDLPEHALLPAISNFFCFAIMGRLLVQSLRILGWPHIQDPWE